MCPQVHSANRQAVWHMTNHEQRPIPDDQFEPGFCKARNRCSERQAIRLGKHQVYCCAQSWVMNYVVLHVVSNEPESGYSLWVHVEIHEGDAKQTIFFVLTIGALLLGMHPEQT